MPSTGFNNGGPKPMKFNPGTGAFTRAGVRGGLGQGVTPDNRLIAMHNEGANPQAPPPSKGPATGLKTIPGLSRPTRRTKRVLTPFDSSYGKQRAFVRSPVVEGQNY